LPDESQSLSRRIFRIPAEIIVAIYVVVDSLVSLLFRPVIRFLSGLRIIQRLEHAIDSLHPYVILVLMVVPFAIAEFTKVFAVYWMSTGHFRSGMTIFIGAYVVSIFVCERILHAGKNKLMTIRWFAVIYTWIMDIRDRLFAWFRETAIWRMVVDLKARAGAMVRSLRDRLRGTAGKPRSAFERR